MITDFGHTQNVYGMAHATMCRRDATMLTVEKIDTWCVDHVDRFVRLPYRLYGEHPLWVPPLNAETELYLHRQVHPFYAHSEADFFIAVRNGRDVGRIAVLEHRLLNSHQGLRQAQFYLFECENDPDAARALFDQACAWARERQLNKLVGPKGFTILDIPGMLIKGFEPGPVLSASPYNFEYYPGLCEQAGFAKEVDAGYSYLDAHTFRLPAWIHAIAARVQQEHALRIQRFATMADLLSTGDDMLETYIVSTTPHQDFYPVPRSEIAFVIELLKTVTNPHLMKAIKHNEKNVGVLFAFPNIATVLQQSRGNINLPALQKAIEQPQALAFNGLGILPEFQLQGVNAWLFTEMEQTVRAAGIRHVEVFQVAETTPRMQRDLAAMGIQPSKIRRVYGRQLAG